MRQFKSFLYRSGEQMYKEYDKERMTGIEFRATHPLEMTADCLFLYTVHTTLPN